MTIQENHGTRRLEEYTDVTRSVVGRNTTGHGSRIGEDTPGDYGRR